MNTVLEFVIITHHFVLIVSSQWCVGVGSGDGCGGCDGAGAGSDAVNDGGGCKGSVNVTKELLSSELLDYYVSVNYVMLIINWFLIWSKPLEISQAFFLHYVLNIYQTFEWVFIVSLYYIRVNKNYKDLLTTFKLSVCFTDYSHLNLNLRCQTMIEIRIKISIHKSYKSPKVFFEVVYFICSHIT